MIVYNLITEIKVCRLRRQMLFKPIITNLNSITAPPIAVFEKVL